MELKSSGLSLTIDNGSPVERDDVSLFESSTDEGISVGYDEGEPAGDYTGSFSFAGDLENTMILIRK